MATNNNSNNQSNPQIQTRSKHKQSLYKTINQLQFTSNRRTIVNEISDSFIQKLTLTNNFGAGFGSPCIFWIENSNIDQDSIIAALGKRVEIWNVKKGEIISSIDAHSDVVTCISCLHNISNFNTSKPVFFSCSLDKTIKFWLNENPVLTIKDHSDWIRCLAINYNDTTLTSACVSSSIYGWDIATGLEKFNIKKAHQNLSASTELSSINSLKFAHSNENLLVSGARDGKAKLWDVRCINDGAVCEIQAHDSKLNLAIWSQNDLKWLTSGRDNAIRLWDFRKINSNMPMNEKKKSFLMEYNQHACNGYFLLSNFFYCEKYVITGTENSAVYIYETETGKLCNILKHKQPIVHLVHPLNTVNLPFSFISATIEEQTMSLWRYSKEKFSVETEQQPTEDRNHILQESFVAAHRSALSSLMSRYGDRIIQLLHKHNVTFSETQNLQNAISALGNSDNAILLKMMSKITNDVSRVINFVAQNLTECEYSNNCLKLPTAAYSHIFGLNDRIIDITNEPIPTYMSIHDLILLRQQLRERTFESKK
eukprot:TRINITY_DN496_c1_g1_i1.p1 TRINITY_DN496_c1_g1~~TRINITY_DN496_c1_g1_i1.p1  ORF type:complete len:539 (-),score=181.82 TRINITY_DN496_c1_g1_i1:748-2364(-)